MPYEIWVGGYPSFLGGADTELDHNIDLWRMYDVDVHLVPMFGSDEKMIELCNQRGCVTHEYKPGIFKDKIVVSYCNGEFLKELPNIIASGAPRCVIWFNCMTWTFLNEIEGHRNRHINIHGFVSNYQKKWLLPDLLKYGHVRELEGYRPYFNPQNSSQRIEFNYRTPETWFALGRISRDDGNKYSADMWRIFDRVITPRQKKVFILGYGPNAHTKCGQAPPSLDWQTWGPNGVPVRQVYNILHCIIHKTGGSRESYCRIVPEAYAYGVPVIVEDDYAFPDLVIDGVTGFRCKSSDEMSFRASELAFNEERRKKMIFDARDFLINELASKEKCWLPWKRVLEEYSLSSNRVFVSQPEMKSWDELKRQK